MNGFLYKQLRQNRIIIIICAVIPVIMAYSMPGLMYLGEEDVSGLESFFRGIAESSILRILYFVFGSIISGMILTASYSGDELKKWVIFCAATPRGGKGLVRSKYLMIFISCLLTLALSVACDTLVCAVCRGVTGEKMTSANMLLLALFFVQLIAVAVELPFTIRFGNKAGNAVKVTVMFGLLFAIIVYLLFGPIPGSFEAFGEKCALLVERIARRDVPSWIIPAFAGVSVTGFLISCAVSERGLLKGIESYDK